jgi:hypothetical protein
MHVATTDRNLVRALALACALLALVVLPAGAQAAAPPPLATQIAEEPVAVSAEAFRRGLFAASDVARLSDPAATQDLVLERVLQARYADNPGLDAATAVAEIDALRAGAATPNLDQNANARIQSALVAFGRTNPTGALARALGVVAADAVQQVRSITPNGDATAFVAAGEFGNSLATTGSFAPLIVLAGTAAQAARSPQFGQARDQLWKSATGASVSDSAAHLLASAPALKDNADVAALAALRNSAGALDTTAGAIAGSALNPAPHTFGAVAAALAGQQALAFQDAAKVAAGTMTREQAIAHGAQIRGSVARGQTAAAIQQVTLNTGRARTQSYAAQAAAVAVAVGSVVSAVTKYNAGQIGAYALTGNIAGAALAAVPAILDLAGVTGGGPNPDELILQQLTALSNQVAAFQTQVNERLDAIDQALGNVLDGIGNLGGEIHNVTLQLNAAQISIDQAKTQITSVYHQVTQLQASVDALRSDIYEALSNVDAGQLRARIASAIGYRERNGTPLPLAQFNDTAAYLHTFATFTAMRSPEINGDNPSYAEQGVAAQLAPGIARNINFLDQLPFQRGWRGSTLSGASSGAAQLPNPDDWALAARAYSQLLLENPDYVTQGYRSWLGDLTQQGAALTRAVAAASAGDTATGTHSTLWNHLLCTYTSIATGDNDGCAAAATSPSQDVVQALGAARDQHLGAMTGYISGVANTTHPLQQANGDPLALWGDGRTTQSSDLDRLWVSTHPTTPQCGPATRESEGDYSTAPQGMGPMQTPGDAAPAIAAIPNVYKLADRLGLGTLSSCWHAGDRWGVAFNFVFTPSVTLSTNQNPVQVGVAFTTMGCQNVWPTSCNLNTVPKIKAYWDAAVHKLNQVTWTYPYVASGGPYFTDLRPTGWARQRYTCAPGEIPWQPGATVCSFSAFEVEQAMDAVVGRALAARQTGLYQALLSGNQTAGNLDSGALRDATQRLDGARQLIFNYAALGLSGSLGRDDTLSGLINGNGRLWGSANLRAAITEAYSDSATGSPPGADPIDAVIAPALGASGPGALETALAANIPAPGAKAAAAAAAAGTSDANPLVESVANRLALTQVASVRGPLVTVTAPAEQATLTSAPAFSGTASAATEAKPTVTLHVYPGADTGGAPVKILTATQTAGAWSTPAVTGLDNGTYTVQAAQADSAERIGRSPAVTFTLAVPAPPANDGAGTTDTPAPTLPASPPQPAAPAAPAAVPKATVARARVRRSTASVAVSCAGPAGTSCPVRLRLSLTEKAKGKKARTVVLATRTVTIAAGKRQTVALVLSANGKRLLASRRTLKATLVADAGATVLAKQALTFKR